jgi:hypothetical protein
LGKDGRAGYALGPGFPGLQEAPDSCGEHEEQQPTPVLVHVSLLEAVQRTEPEGLGGFEILHFDRIVGWRGRKSHPWVREAKPGERAP